jgi:hypothetical protein
MTISEPGRALKGEKTYLTNIIRAERQERSVTALDRERIDLNAKVIEPLARLQSRRTQDVADAGKRNAFM